MFTLNRRALTRLCAAIVALGAPAIAACSGPSPTLSALPAQPALTRPAGNATLLEFTYKTLDDPDDATTEILGINNLGKICGLYGSPYTGFVARPPYQAGNFRKIAYPGAVETIMAAVDDQESTAGWYKDTHGRIFGLTYWKGLWQTYQDPKLLRTGKSYTELLGLENGGIAVGFYQDTRDVDHAFEVNILSAQYHGINPPGAISSAATGINGKGDIVGWLTLSNGTTEGWLLKGTQFTEFGYPKALSTYPEGINWSDDIVGSFQGKGKEVHGFILTNPLTSQTWQQVDEPDSDGVTVVQGVSNHHTMVGYYEDAKRNINGFLATEK